MKTLLKFISGFISFLLSICLFLLFFLFILLSSLRSSFDGDAIKNAVYKIDFSSFISFGDMRSGGFERTAQERYLRLSSEDGPDADLKLEINDEIEEMLSEHGITREMVEKYLSSELVNVMAGELLARYSEGFYEYIAQGQTDVAVDGEFVKELFEQNLDEIEDVIGMEIGDEEKEQFFGAVDNIALEIEKNLPRYDEIAESIGSSEGGFDEIREKYINPMLSPFWNIFPVCAMIAICALIALLRHSWYRWMGWTGTALLGAGIFVLFFGFISSEILNILVGEGRFGLLPVPEKVHGIFAETPIVELIIHILKPLPDTLFLHGIITSCVAVVLIVLYFVFGSAAKKRLHKEARQEF